MTEEDWKKVEADLKRKKSREELFRKYAGPRPTPPPPPPRRKPSKPKRKK